MFVTKRRYNLEKEEINNKIRKLNNHIDRIDLELKQEISKEAIDYVEQNLIQLSDFYDYMKDKTYFISEFGKIEVFSFEKIHVFYETYYQDRSSISKFVIEFDSEKLPQETTDKIINILKFSSGLSNDNLKNKKKGK